MDYLRLDKVDSTNKYAKEHIEELSDKTVIYTSYQTAGRGRLARKWNYMGEDNIYASIVLKPSKKMQDVYSNLTQYLCLVLCETLEEYNIIPKIKWPNDVQINGKKISGILAEGVINNNELEGLVLGFGVNLNCDKNLISNINQPATSLNLEINKKVDKELFLKTLLDKFFLRYDKFIEEGFILIKSDYLKRAGFLKKNIKVRVFDAEIEGLAENITDKGALVLKDKNNEEHVLYIGDIL